MPTEPKKPLIVISYADADAPEHPAEGEVKWLSFVTGYLRPAIKHGAVDLWIDRRMPGGADWEREIAQKLRACEARQTGNRLSVTAGARASSWQTRRAPVDRGPHSESTAPHDPRRPRRPPRRSSR